MKNQAFIVPLLLLGFSALVGLGLPVVGGSFSRSAHAQAVAAPAISADAARPGVPPALPSPPDAATAATAPPGEEPDTYEPEDSADADDADDAALVRDDRANSGGANSDRASSGAHNSASPNQDNAHRGAGPSPPAGRRPTGDGSLASGRLTPAGPAGLQLSQRPVTLAAGPRRMTGAGGKIRHVLIISEDGLRPDLIESQYMPWHERLSREGSHSWHARTIRTASTLPAHASMLSGVDVNRHGLTWNNWRPDKGFIHVSTIFQEAGEHGLKTAAFVGKFKLRHILPAGTVGVFERPGYLCKKVSEEAARYLVKEKPDLTFVHFSDPDEAGHAQGWLSEPYRKAGAATDKCLGILYQALERAGMLDDTLIIVSADHGGHNHTHSGALACDREIPWIARGPDVRRDYVIRGKISTMDTAATALTALGLPISPDLVGKPVTEIFR